MPLRDTCQQGYGWLVFTWAKANTYSSCHSHCNEVMRPVRLQSQLPWGMVSLLGKLGGMKVRVLPPKSIDLQESQRNEATDEKFCLERYSYLPDGGEWKKRA